MCCTRSIHQLTQTSLSATDVFSVRGSNRKCDSSLSGVIAFREVEQNQPVTTFTLYLFFILIMVGSNSGWNQ